MTDISQALRELLLARAAGQIDGEEFERRQAALHAELLLPTSAATHAETAGPQSLSRTTREWWPWGLGVIILIAASGLYLWLGKPIAMMSRPATPLANNQPVANDAGKPGSGGDLKVMAGRLAERLAKEPANGEGWALLAQTYLELRQHKDAADAFAKADALAPADAKTLADWADALVVANGRKWDKKAKALVARALAADPKNLKVLALAGSEAFDRADYKTAISYWNKMKDAAPGGSMDAKLAEANIQEATALMSGKRLATPAGEAPAASSFIAGTVSIAPALKARLGGNATVFVVAKATDGSPAPVAVKRYAVADLPASFQLGDADAMSPARTLSRFGAAEVSARLSKSGDALPKEGDVVSNRVRVKTGAVDVRLELR